VRICIFFTITLHYSIKQQKSPLTLTYVYIALSSDSRFLFHVHWKLFLAILQMRLKKWFFV